VHEEQLKHARLRTYHGLCCAFAAMKDDGATALSLEQHWRPLLDRLRPELDPHQVSWCNSTTDTDGIWRPFRTCRISHILQLTLSHYTAHTTSKLKRKRPCHTITRHPDLHCYFPLPQPSLFQWPITGRRLVYFFKRRPIERGGAQGMGSARRRRTYL
jgi:hypothetical protein